MFRLRRVTTYLAAVALAVAVAACGGSSSGPTTPTPTPTPTPCTQTTLKQEGGGIPPSTLVYDDFSVADSGRLDVTLDWTFATSEMGFYVVLANTCTLDQFNARACNFLVRSEPSTTKPRKISTPNFAAGNYRWMIGNFAEVDESVSLLIVLSRGSCPALTAAPPSATQRAEGAWPALKRALQR